MRADERDDAVGLAGYGCLITLALAGGLGGTALLMLGIGRVVGAGRMPVQSGAEARELSLSLEWAVALCGFGALALLIGAVAGVVLLKELSDDASRRERGALSLPGSVISGIGHLRT